MQLSNSVVGRHSHGVTVTKGRGGDMTLDGVLCYHGSNHLLFPPCRVR